MNQSTIDVVHVGSAARDLTDDDPRGWRLGGGASYGALTTARLGLRTAALVGVDGPASTASELDLLRAAGVELRLEPLDQGPVFRNVETPTGRVQTCAPGQPLPVTILPAGWLAAPGWSLVPVAGELGDDWAPAVPAGALVSLGWQGLLRAITPDHRVERLPPQPSALLDRADLIGVSRHDLAPGTDLDGLVRWLRRGAVLVVTDGPGGGQVSEMTVAGQVRTWTYAAIDSGHEVDPTGAGDVFLAALATSIIRPGIAGRQAEPDPNDAPAGGDLQFAAAAASLVVEAPGLHGVPRLEAVLERLAGARPVRSPGG